ncbi:glutathionylspermidine synthase family protein [Litchfieldia salsa]|uniref:Glutathionylspermidine synthase n=1 Tax=Litchfieldia salsa TaxID=930152 RepID=A0A1H0SUG0_9BACI|nr:glutathionylspermidine synthase family protein [Litchfieldia salsa]SDP45324.1 Glutathionylspermidine synthase [Litchfieldia salsa]
MDISEHKRNREQFYSKLPNYWPDLYGIEYSLFDIKMVNEQFSFETREFAKKAGHIFFKTAQLLQSNLISDDTLLQMGYPKETLSLIRLRRSPFPTVISRFDSVIVNGKHKLLEFNADTPTFIYELFKVNEHICQEFNCKNPNEYEEARLKTAINRAISSATSRLGKPSPNIVFTSHSDNIEDRQTVLYLKELTVSPSQYVSLDQLRIIKGEALLDPNGNVIDILYRQTFPIESLILDQDPTTNDKVGEQLLELVDEHKLLILNPPSAFLMQNKAMMSVIWGLHEESSPFFTEEEHGWIEDHFLPTYLEPDRFIEEKIKYVKKPVFGREGDTIEIFDEAGTKIEEDHNKSYTNYIAVYQQFVDLPTTTIRTEAGEQQGHYMIGTFLLNGSPSAFGFRVGQQITNNLSYFLPVGYEK